MIVAVTFEREVEQLPKSCSVCPFVDACDRMIGGITKRGGMEFTAKAPRGRVKGCPLRIDVEYRGVSVETIAFMYDYLRGRDLDLHGNYTRGLMDGVKVAEQRIAESLYRDHEITFDVIGGDEQSPSFAFRMDDVLTTKPLSSE